MRRRSLIFAAPPLPYVKDVGEANYEVGQEHPSRARIGVFDLIFVHQGCLHIGEEDMHYDVSPGEILILRPDCRHYATQPCGQDTHFHWLHFQAPLFAETRDGREPIWLAQVTQEQISREHLYDLSLSAYGQVPDASRVRGLLAQLQAAERQSQMEAFWRQQMLFLELLRLLDEGQRESELSSHVRVASEVEAYIRTHYASPITNETLAHRFHFHPNYITRCMLEVFRCTPVQYVLKRRVEQAQLLLIKTDWSIARVGQEVGFMQLSHFSRRFARVAGLSPAQYRRQFILSAHMSSREKG